MPINNPEIDKIFDDLDNYRDFCRFNAKVFNEADLYKMSSENWRSYQNYLKHRYENRQSLRNHYSRHRQ